MTATTGGATPAERLSGEKARARLLAGLAVTERRLDLAGISTAVLEGGDGPPLVLLHDPSEHAAKWFPVLPELVTTHSVVAPDLPGHGGSAAPEGTLDVDRVLTWLRELIEQTCASRPALVGLILGGGIAARFTVHHQDLADRLVLVDALGLAPLSPTPEFGQALEGYLAAPTAQSHDHLWSYCAFDLGRVRDRMGEKWEPFTAANLDRLATPAGQAAVHDLMAAFGMPVIPAEHLARIAVPTTLIWGRHDLATPLEIAEAASARYGWPLHVINDCADDPVIEQPEAFLRALHVALGRTITRMAPGRPVAEGRS
ncbi:MAG: alpha/beta hydrolase [Actinomycetota bacterium]|nr:alpha/beta hydrolase [Actinomycetota bacterium]